MMALDPSNLPEILTAPQAGLILGRSGGTVVRWTRDGKITPIGRLTGPRGTFLYSRADVEALAAALQQT